MECINLFGDGDQWWVVWNKVASCRFAQGIGYFLTGWESVSFWGSIRHFLTKDK